MIRCTPPSLPRSDSHLAGGILRDHLVFICLIIAVLVIQLCAG
jgi:hypothetical protein